MDVSYRSTPGECHSHFMADPSRYRDENGESCVDVNAASIEHIFDNRDPAPFRERDLDPDLVEYLIDASEDLVAHKRFRVVFWLDQPCEPREIEQAFRAHFAFEQQRLLRTRRRHRRTGLIALAVALVLFVALLSAAELVQGFVGGSLGATIHEGLVISCWVLLWRPIDLLLYDWIPWRRERNVVRRLVVAAVDVRVGKGPDPRVR